MRTKIDLAPMEEFLTKDIHPDDLGNYLDEIMYEYAMNALNHPDEIKERAESKMFYLRELRDIMRAIATG